MSQIIDMVSMGGDWLVFIVVSSPMMAASAAFLFSLLLLRGWDMAIVALLLLWVSVVAMSFTYQGMNLIDGIYASISVAAGRE